MGSTEEGAETREQLLHSNTLLKNNHALFARYIGIRPRIKKKSNSAFNNGNKTKD